MSSSTHETHEAAADSTDASPDVVSGADEYIDYVTIELQAANAARDSHQATSLLVDLLRHADAIRQQRPDLQKQLQLIQVTAQSLALCRSSSQVVFDSSISQSYAQVPHSQSHTL